MSKDKTIGKTLDALTGVFSPNEGNVMNMISFLLPKLKVEDLREAILKYEKYMHDPTLDDAQRSRLFGQVDPVVALFDQFSINKYKGVRKIIKRKSKENGKRWWDYIADYLSKPEKMALVMGQDQRIKDMLETKEGIEYLKFTASRSYDFFFHWVWDFPRRHTLDDGKIISKRIKLDNLPSFFGFKCVRCGLVWSDEQMRKEYENPVTTYLFVPKSKR